MIEYIEYILDEILNENIKLRYKRKNKYYIKIKKITYIYYWNNKLTFYHNINNIIKNIKEIKIV